MVKKCYLFRSKILPVMLVILILLQSFTSINVFAADDLSTVTGKWVEVPLTNGNFESGLANWWGFAANNNGSLAAIMPTVETNSANIYEGSKSVKLPSTNTERTSAYATVAKKDGNKISFEPNTTYRITAMVKGSDINLTTSVPPKAGVNMSITEVTTVKTVVGPTGTFDWTELVLEFNSEELKAGETAPFLGRLNITLNGWGTLWVDDVKLSKYVIAPPKVENLNATLDTAKTVNLSWDSVTTTGAAIYCVYRSTTANFTADDATNKIKDVTAPTTSYADVGLPAGTYYYKVCAKDSIGTEGPLSNEVSVTINSELDKVQNLKVSLDSIKTVNLWWDPVTTSGAAIYTIYRGTESGVTNKIIEVTDVTSYSDMGLAAGSYYYKVSAKDSTEAVGPASDEISVIIPADPERLVELPLVNGGFESGLANWAKVSANGGSDAVVETNMSNVYEGSKSIKLVSGGTQESAYSTITKRKAEGNSISFEPNTKYRLSAKIKGESIVIPKDRAGINMSISEVTTGKSVLLGKTGEFDWSELVLEFNSEELTPAQTGPFLARLNFTINGWGTFWLDDVSLQVYTTDSTPPAQVNNLKAEGKGDKSVQLSWDAVIDSSSLEYYIYRGTTPDFTADAASKIFVSKVTSYADVDLPLGDYYYKVCAVDRFLNIGQISAVATGISFIDPNVQPKISWSDSFIKPGEHMNIEGGDFIEGTTKIKMGYLQNGDAGTPPTSNVFPSETDLTGVEDITILQFDNNVLSMKVPTTIPTDSIIGFYLQNNTKSSVMKRINAPSIEWTPNPFAQAGTEVKLIGKNLTGTDMKVYISQKDGVYKGFATVSSHEMYALKFNIPADAPNGHYDVWVHNGKGGQFGWSEPFEINVSPDPILMLKANTTVFNVTEFGVVGDNSTDNTAAIQALIDAKSAIGGGIIYFPNGTYLVKGMVQVKPGIVIKGQSIDQTIIKDMQGSGIRQALFTGNSDYGIENLKIDVTYSRKAVSAPGWMNHDDYYAIRAAVANNMWPGINYPIDAKITGANATYMGFAKNIYVDNVVIDQKTVNPDSDGNKNAITGVGFSGENLVINNCSITNHTGGHPIHIFGGEDIRITNNKLYYILHGWTRLQATRNIYVENNEIQASGAGSGYFFGATNLGQENVYAAHNKAFDLAGSDAGEGMCLDAQNAGTFFGTIASATENTLSFSNFPKPENSMNGQSIAIMEGRGKGQVRIIKNSSVVNGIHTIVLDKPFDVVPNSSSSILIEQMVNNAIFAFNEFRRVNVGVSFWGHSNNIISDGNYNEELSIMNSGGAMVKANYNTAKGSTPKPIFHVYMINNKVKAGNITFLANAYAARGSSGSSNTNSILNATNLFYGVIRGNTVENGYQIILGVDTLTDTTVTTIPNNNKAIQGVIVEGNSIQDTNLGAKSSIYITSKGVWGTIVAGNDSGSAFEVTDYGTNTIRFSAEGKLPDKPILVSPLMGSTAFKRSQFSWKNGGNALTCNIIFSKNADMSNPVIYKKGLLQMNYDGAQYDVPANELLEADTKYYWQVELVNTTGETASDIGSFTTLKDEDYIRVEVEDFLMEGASYGKDITWHDNTAGNRLNAGDTKTDVDVVNGRVGWTEVGEWLKYKVNIGKSGVYSIVLPYATGMQNQKIALKNDETGEYLIPNDIVASSGGFDNWKDLSFTDIPISAGTYTLKLEIGGVINLDWIDFIYKGDLSGIVAIKGSTPVSGAKNVTVETSNLMVEFTTAMNPETLNPENITLYKNTGSGDTKVNYIAYEKTDSTYTIKLQEHLDYAASYKISISTAVSSVSSQPIKKTDIVFFTEGMPDPIAPTTMNVMINGTASVYETLTGSYLFKDMNLDPEGSSTYRWLAADTADGQYTAIAGATSKQYTLTASDKGKYIKFEVTPVSTVEPFVGVPVISAPSPKIEAKLVPAPWKTKLIGNVEGFAVYDNGQYNLKASGADVWADHDDFLYVYQDVDASLNEVSVTAKLDSLQNLNKDGMAGIMFRSSDAPNAANVFLRIKPDGALLTTYRLANGSNSQYNSTPSVGFPTELKLTRNGNTITGYYKKDGIWIQTYQVTIDMAMNMLVGIATCSHAASIGEAKFSQLQLIGSVPDAVQNLKAVLGSDKSVSLSWDAVISSEAYIVYRSTNMNFTPSDSNKIAEVTSATQYLDQNLADGTYYYMVCAKNSAGAGMASDKISVVINETTPPTTDTDNKNNNDIKKPTVSIDVKETTDKNTTTVSTSVEVITDSKTGIASAKVAKNVFEDLTDKAKKAEASGKKAVVEINAEIKNALKAIGLEIPRATFNQLADSTNAELRLNTGIGSITFDANAVNSIRKELNEGDVKISLSKVDTSTLDQEVQSKVGVRPVYDFTVKAGSTEVSTFNGGKASISITYSIKPGEDRNAIIVYSISDTGRLEAVRGKYDPKTGRVNFITTYFSQYTVGYNKVNFSDVSANAWYNTAVTFVSARGIADGVSGDSFAPQNMITRADFLIMVLKSFGIKPDTTITENFSDAGNKYYTSYLATAKRLGLVSGVGKNNYAPEANMNRQDMFVILYNVLDKLGEIPTGSGVKNIESFNDSVEIAAYARNAMKLFVETGTISGDGNKLNPKDKSTRVQAAQILYNLLSK